MTSTSTYYILSTIAYKSTDILANYNKGLWYTNGSIGYLSKFEYGLNVGSYGIGRNIWDVKIGLLRTIII